MNIRVLFAAFAAAVALALLSGGCSNGGEEPASDSTSTPVATPTADGTKAANEGTATPAGTPAATGTPGTPSPVVTETLAGTPGGAVIDYVTHTGLNGKTYKMAELTNCKSITTDAEKQAANGKVCIHFANSSFAETSGTAEVWVFGTEDVYILTLELKGSTWTVTDTEYTPRPVLTPTVQPTP